MDRPNSSELVACMVVELEVQHFLCRIGQEQGQSVKSRNRTGCTGLTSTILTPLRSVSVPLWQKRPPLPADVRSLPNKQPRETVGRFHLAKSTVRFRGTGCLRRPASWIRLVKDLPQKISTLAPGVGGVLKNRGLPRQGVEAPSEPTVAHVSHEPL